MKKIFLCFPLRHENLSVVKERIKNAKEYSLTLFKIGDIPFSPGLVGMDMMDNNPEHGLDISFKTWQNFCYSYLEVCDELHLLKYEGWEKSEGIKGEIAQALKLNKIIKTIDF